jgi:hypothetical protein
LHLLLENFDLHEHLRNQNTTIIRWLTNLKKRSNLDYLYFLFFWYEFPYLFFRWTTKEMQLLHLVYLTLSTSLLFKQT